MKILFYGGITDDDNEAFNQNNNVYYTCTRFAGVTLALSDLNAFLQHNPTTKGTTMQRFFILERTPQAPFEFRVTVAEAKDRAEVDAEFKVTEKFVLEDVFTDSEEMLSLLDRYLQLADGSS